MALRGAATSYTLWVGLLGTRARGALLRAGLLTPGRTELGRSAGGVGIAFTWARWCGGALVARCCASRRACPAVRHARDLLAPAAHRPTDGGEQSAFQLGLLIFLSIIALYGTPPVSAYLIGVRILSLCFVPGLGFSTAAATLVGQHLGARRPELAARVGWRAAALAVGVMGGVGLAIALAAPYLARLFGAAGPETIALSVTFIYVLGAAQP